eukprot:11101237-Alexandrium_andersonii.AAC.1
MANWGVHLLPDRLAWAPTDAPQVPFLDLLTQDESEWNRSLHVLRGHWRVFRLNRWLTSARRDATAACLASGRGA